MASLYKKSELEFDVIYKDGSRRHVREGVLFEDAETQLHVHIGTDNQLNMFLAIIKAMAEMLSVITKGKVTIRIEEKPCEK